MFLFIFKIFLLYIERIEVDDAFEKVNPKLLTFQVFHFVPIPDSI